VPIGAGSWASLTVEFPEEVELGYVLGHTGHSGTFHPADRIQLERRCICNSSDSTGCTSASASACANPPANGGVFEFVAAMAATPDQLMPFAAKQARTWKVALRATSSGHVVVRGLRFFAPDGAELFPARSTP